MASLVVETGSVVAGANSFVSLVDARTIADYRGITLPVLDDDAITALIQGGIYVNNQEGGLQGVRVSIDQTMCFPRSGVVKYGFEVPNDSIPNEVICSQVEAASQIGAGVNPYANNEGKEVSNETVVGAVAVSYFESGKTDSNVLLTTADNCILPLTLLAIGAGGGFNFSVSRG